MGASRRATVRIEPSSIDETTACSGAFDDDDDQASAKRSGGSSIREPVEARARSEAGGASSASIGAGRGLATIARSARSGHRAEDPEPGGKAPPQGLDVTQGPAFEAVGADGSGAGDSSADAQQHRVLHSMPHAHR